MDKLVITISGQIVRENSANLMNFWRGFINIQNAIDQVSELKIVAHSWNPEFDELVKHVYNPDFLESEKQGSFVKEYMPLLKPIDKFEHGLKRANSTWWKVNPNVYSGQISSKTKSILLLDKLGLNADDFVLSTRWDIGCSGGKEVNTIIFDSSLDRKYLYMAYYPYVDEGYADMWFLSCYQNIKTFQLYKHYFLDSIAGNNSYFEDFTKNGWPLSLQQNGKMNNIKINIKRKLAKIIFKFPFNFFKKLLPFLLNKIVGVENRLKSFFSEIHLTGENSLPLHINTNNTYPTKQSLNIHAILKSFIISNNLREKTKFLDINDFEKHLKGQMINPLEFCYVVYSHSSFSDCWEMAIKQALENLPENCGKIFLCSDNSQLTREKFGEINMNGIDLLTYDNEDKYTDRLINIFSTISQRFNFIYFVHEDMPLIGRVDKVFLNTLLHYMNNSNEYYIKLVDTSYVDTKEDHESFPYLVKNMGKYSISVQPSLLKADFFIAFLKNFHQDIYGYENTCLNSNFIFSAVKGNRKIGKYLLVNNKFPHLATAISKGRWCLSEWKDEINYLSKKYNINISIRGKC